MVARIKDWRINHYIAWRSNDVVYTRYTWLRSMGMIFGFANPLACDSHLDRVIGFDVFGTPFHILVRHVFSRSNVICMHRLGFRCLVGCNCIGHCLRMAFRSSSGNQLMLLMSSRHKMLFLTKTLIDQKWDEECLFLLFDGGKAKDGGWTEQLLYNDEKRTLRPWSQNGKSWLKRLTQLTMIIIMISSFRVVGVP